MATTELTNESVTTMSQFDYVTNFCDQLRAAVVFLWIGVIATRLC